MSLRPYLAGFRLALNYELSHRTNFLIGKLREFIFFAALILLFQQLPHGVGRWEQDALLTYTVVSAFLSTQLTSAQAMNTMADEISSGDLTNFLVRPLNYLGYWTARLCAVRLLTALGGALSVLILLLLFPSIHLTLPHDPRTWLAASVLALGSLVLMQLLDFTAGLIAFWTDRAYGPRFLVIILVQFLSGAYLPIDTFPAWTQRLLHATPFPSLLFAPVSTLLDGVSEQTALVLRTQIMWIAIFAIILTLVWRQGLRTYAAYGK